MHWASAYAAASSGKGQAKDPFVSSPAPLKSTTASRMCSKPNAFFRSSASDSIVVESLGNLPVNELFARSSVVSEVWWRSAPEDGEKDGSPSKEAPSGTSPAKKFSERSSTRRLGSAANRDAGSVPLSPLFRACRCVRASRLAPGTPRACGNAPKAPIAETLSRFKRAIGRIARLERGPVIKELPSTRNDSRSSRRLLPSQFSSGPSNAFPSSRKCTSESRSPSHTGTSPAMLLFASESMVKPPTRSSAFGKKEIALDDKSSRSRYAANENAFVCGSSSVSV